MTSPDFLPALERALGMGVENLMRLSGGASQETWSFDSIRDNERLPLILRRAPNGVARTTGIPLSTEAAVIEASRAAGVAAPRVRHVLQPGEGAGDGYVMDRLAGETIARKILRDAEFAGVRPKLARDCGRALARIHRVELDALRALLPVVDGPAQLQSYHESYDAFDYPHPVFEIAFQWLAPRMVRSGRETLVHGDFRLGNLLVSPNGLEAALDWELAHIGDPLEDIGWICTAAWRFGRQDKVVGGFGDLPDLLGGYEEESGIHIAPQDVRPWIVYGSLKWGIMCMKMYQGFLLDRSVERAAIGRRSSENEIDLVNMIVGGKL